MGDYGDVDSPVFIGELRGYRGWVLPSERDKLSSIFKRFDWSPGVNIAECRQPWHDLSDDPCPSPYCTCGFYAHYSVKDAVDYCSGLIYGSIMASGTIIPGTRGFRAERARVEAVILPFTFATKYGSERIEEVRETYPDVKILSNAAKFKKEFPSTPNPWQKSERIPFSDTARTSLYRRLLFRL